MLTVIGSMEYELAGLRKELNRFPAGARLTPGGMGASALDLQVVGVGRACAEQSVRRLLHRGRCLFGGEAERPEGLLLLGFAGAVDPALRTGDLILSSRYYAVEPTENPPNLPLIKGGEGGARGGYLEPDPVMWRHALQAAAGQQTAYVDSLTVNCLVTTPEQKQAIMRQCAVGVAHPVGVVNMEDYWIAAAAQDFGVAFLSARVVLDPAHQALPGYLPSLARSRTWAALAMAATPWRIPALVRLARQVPAAQRALSRFALNFVAQMADEESAPPLPVSAVSGALNHSGSKVLG